MKGKIKYRNKFYHDVTTENRKEARSKQFIRRQLINQNGAVCSLCGETIENMKDCTIDHIIPKSKGGLTTIQNCQLAHKECNSRKGDGIAFSLNPREV